MPTRNRALPTLRLPGITRPTWGRTTVTCVTVVLLGTILSAGLAWGIGFSLGETKEQLGLKYDVALTDHGTGRVTVNLSIADQGKMQPLTAVDLVIPSSVDLSVSLAIEEVDGKQVVRAHLKRDLAERAELQLKTRTLDGKQQPLTWYYHTIPLAEYLKK